MAVPSRLHRPSTIVSSGPPRCVFQQNILLTYVASSIVSIINTCEFETLIGSGFQGGNLDIVSHQCASHLQGGQGH